MKKDPKITIHQSELDELKYQMKRSQDDCFEWKNKYFMELADMQNLRKSIEEDHRNAMRYRAEGFLENLIPALDGFFMALASRPNSDEAKNYQQGFVYIYNQIQNALVSEGVAEILPKVGDLFDPTCMNAVDTEEGNEENDNQIAFIYSKGYKLHDKLIRPVMVRVFKKKETAEPKEETKEAEQA